MTRPYYVLLWAKPQMSDFSLIKLVGTNWVSFAGSLTRQASDSPLDIAQLSYSRHLNQVALPPYNEAEQNQFV